VTLSRWLILQHNQETGLSNFGLFGIVFRTVANFAHLQRPRLASAGAGISHQRTSIMPRAWPASWPSGVGFGSGEAVAGCVYRAAAPSVAGVVLIATNRHWRPMAEVAYVDIRR